MRKKHILIMLAAMLFSNLTSCGKKPIEVNFLGGNGTLKSVSNSNRYAGQVYEDESYYYYDGFKWSKTAEMNQATLICTKMGCDHTSPDCILRKYGYSLTFDNNVVYWGSGQTLFSISSDGNITEIAKFTKDSNGIEIPETVTIDKVTVLNSDWVYIYMSYASGLYRLSDKHFVPLLSSEVVSNDTSLFYLDNDQIIHCFSYNDEKDEELTDARSYILILNDNLLYYGDGHTSYCYNIESKETKALRFFPEHNYNEMIIYADNETIYFTANDYDPMEGSMSFNKTYRMKNDVLEELPESINTDWIAFLNTGEIVWIDAGAINEQNTAEPCGIHLYQPDMKQQHDYWVIR